MASTTVKVESPRIKYTDKYIEANYLYCTTQVSQEGNTMVVKPNEIELQIRTNRRVPRLGIMLVGWGGNNGSTFTAGLIANKNNIAWTTKNGEVTPNWYGSITQSSTVNLGLNDQNESVYVPMSDMLPMVNPNDIVVDGWDISSLNLAESMQRAKVIDYDLQNKLQEHMTNLVPRAAIYSPDFIADNQGIRADNIIQGSKQEQLQRVQEDIRKCMFANGLDKVIVVWTANTERFSDIVPGINDTATNMLKAIENNSDIIAPSTIYAVASILEGCTFINGSPQNTFVPGVLQLAQRHGTFIAGDDFKTGQTKLKSVLIDFLVTAGIKPLSIVSYNHLGNNDGLNLSSSQQFRSKEVSKRNVVDDIVRSNTILYKENETPDHCVVIKYVPTVGDSKRAMDEYTSELMLGGRNTLVIHNTCEDSLLAAPIILDLVLIAEILERVSVKRPAGNYTPLNPILSILGYLCKAPLVPQNSPVVNSLFRQRACIENIFRACLSLPPENNMLLEFKLREPSATQEDNQSNAKEGEGDAIPKVTINWGADNGFS